MSVEWFAFRGKMHARNPAKQRLVSHCGLAPAASPRIETLTEAEVPTRPCPRCLVAVAVESTSDEPIEDALERGFLPVDADQVI